MMTPDVAQGVYAELQHILKADWNVRRDQEGFILTPPKEPSQSDTKFARLSQEAWRIAQFVAYSEFCSLRKTADGGIEIVTKMPNGNGLRLLIEAN